MPRVMISLFLLFPQLLMPIRVMAEDPAIGVILPEHLQSVDGQALDVSALAARSRLIVVTLKATWCPVCRIQLQRLEKILPRLRSCGASFIVLAPGPREALAQVASGSGFPFVEDVGLSIARSAKFDMAEDLIEPVMFAVDRERRITWVQRGRNGKFYGDDALLKFLDCREWELAQAAGR